MSSPHRCQFSNSFKIFSDFSDKKVGIDKNLNLYISVFLKIGQLVFHTIQQFFMK